MAECRYYVRREDIEEKAIEISVAIAVPPAGDHRSSFDWGGEVRREAGPKL